jgi:tyrosyl-tRNA synthetase
MFGKSNKKAIVDDKKIENLLSKNVEEIFIKESLEKKLRSGKVLRVKLGFDPTGPRIHIGRAIVLRKLKEFQDLGHSIIFLVGDFTAKIGDPSDKLEKRPMLTDVNIAENLKNYKKQVGKILDLKKVEFHYNSKWLSKLTFKEIVELAESFSVSQMSNRRNFKERLDRGEEVSLREFMYPLMQGYDSVALNADVEIGGFDQLFNLKAGRIVQKHFGKPEQDILTINMLEGTDGRKMSTSWGNVINILDEPNDMFGKVMSMSDDLIVKYFNCATDLSKEEVKKIEREIVSGVLHPKEAKMKLAGEIVRMFWDEKSAVSAKNNFESVFSGGAAPENIEEVFVGVDSKLVDVLLDKKLITSRSEMQRLVGEGAIKNLEGDVKIDNRDFVIKETITLKIGKKRFIKIIIKD